MAEDLMLEILKAIQAHQAAIQADQVGTKQSLARLELAVDKMNINQTIMAQDIRLVRAAINDIERTRISTGEIEALHTEVNELRDRVATLEARMLRL